MNMNQSEKWLFRNAKLEDNGFISVGGLVNRLSDSQETECSSATRVRALARVIDLSRRKLRLTVEQLADRADIDVSEILSLEGGEIEVPEPRTVFKLSEALNVPQHGLMILSGLANPRDEAFDEEVVRFAARSESMEVLSPEEESALQEFVRVMAD